MSRRGRDDRDDSDLDLPLRRMDGAEPANACAIASMIMGISALVIYFAGYLCICLFPPFAFLPWGMAILLGVISVILGFIGNTPGSQGFAWTGIICSLVTIVFFVLSLVLALIFGLALFAGAGGF